MAIVCPKCGVENPDTEYFCTQCHAHIRSAFGAPVSVGADSSAQAPVSIFPATAAPVSSAPEPALLDEADTSAEREVTEPVATILDLHPAVVLEPAAEPGDNGLDQPDEAAAGADPADHEHTLTIVTDGTRIDWNLRPAQSEVDSELAELLELERAEHRVGAPAVPPPAPPPDSIDLSSLSDTAVSVYEALRKSAGTYVKLPPSASLRPGQPAATSNTSGQGAQAVLPSEAQGWSWAGFVPGGAFGFTLGQPLLGVLGLAGLLTGRFGLFYLWPLYLIVVGLKGRELAWRQRRFGSVAQYVDTLAAWDSVGKFCIIIDIVIYALFIAVGAALETP